MSSWDTLETNQIFNKPKRHSSRFAKGNRSFTYMYKTIVEIHLQETMNNALIALVLSMSIDVCFFFFISHNTCQLVNCVCQLTCDFLKKLIFKMFNFNNFNIFWWMRVFACQKWKNLAKTLSNIHTAMYNPLWAFSRSRMDGWSLRRTLESSKP